jgi:hypothetical protein
MTQKKQKLSKRTHKKQKISHKPNKSRRIRYYKKWGGSCGCGAKFTGGSCSCQTHYRGGSAFLNQLNPEYFYKFSDHVTDPTNPSAIVDERLAGDFSRTTGGKGKRRMRKIKGGSNLLTNTYGSIANSGSDMNYITSFGIPNGVGSQVNLLSATNPLNSSNTMLHPVTTNPYGFHNLPLA